MYYLLLLLLLIIGVYVLTHVMSSLFKGCLTAVLILIVGLFAFFLVKSASEPINVLDFYVIDNFEITKIEK